MVLLSCAIIGEGSVISIIIEEWKTVALLKKAIKKKKPATIKCDAKDVQLFLARKDGAWLDGASAAAVALDEDGTLRGFGDQMNPTLWIKNAKYFGENFQPGEGQVHALVVVPQQRTSAQIVSQHGVFDHCSDQFFAQFPMVDEVDGWLEFPTLLLLTKYQALYVRSSYRVIAEQALMNPDASMVKYTVITGTPGIGKSVFIYYVMWRLIKEKKRVLFLTKKPAVYFDGNAIWDCDQLPKPGNRQFWSPDLWCLVDSKDPTGIAELPIDYCSVLLASTPRRDCIGEFKKLCPTPDVFYMPLWTDEELTKIAPLYPHAADVWRDRLDCLGTVPRLVLQDIQKDPQALLTSACNDYSLGDYITLISIYFEINLIIQALIHIRSEEPYRDYSVAYASKLAIQVIARTKWRSDRKRMQDFLGPFHADPLTQSLRGYIFEPHAMHLLEQGGRFQYRKLLFGIDMRRRDDEYIDIPASPQGRQIVERVERDQRPNQLYVPRTSNYAAIDAWMPDFGGFQMTVGRSHDIKGGAAEDLEKLGQNGNRLYFLLPPLYYKSFTKKTPQTIEQFAIVIPYPEDVY